MTKVALNKTTKDFALSRRTYNWLIQNRGWRYIGCIDMNREGTSITSLIDANDDPIPVTIATTATGPGTITRRDGSDTPLKIGDNVIYDFIPNTGKKVLNVIVDGVDCGSGVASHAFTSLTDNYTLEVVFGDAPAVETGENVAYIFSSPGGEVSHKGTVVVADGGAFNFTATPYPGFTFDSIKVDGIPVDISALTENSTYTYSNTDLTADVSIAVYFKPITPLEIVPQKSTKLLWNDLFNKWYMSVTDRSDGDLIAAIETINLMGPNMASGDGCDIVIIEIPDNITAWEVRRNCQGLEIVTTPYQQWE
jgi:hypothetical protein